MRTRPILYVAHFDPDHLSPTTEPTMVPASGTAVLSYLCLTMPPAQGHLGQQVTFSLHELIAALGFKATLSPAAPFLSLSSSKAPFPCSDSVSWCAPELHSLIYLLHLPR